MIGYTQTDAEKDEKILHLKQELSVFKAQAEERGLSL